MWKDILSGLNVTSKHHFQVTQNNDSDNNNDIIRNTKNEATTNDTTMTLSVPTNIKNEMTDNLKHLENKTISLFNITYYYAIDGSLLNSLADLFEFLNHYQNYLGKTVICCIKSMDLIDGQLNKLNVLKSILNLVHYLVNN